MRMNPFTRGPGQLFSMFSVSDQFVLVLFAYNIFSLGDRNSIWTHNWGELSLVLSNDITHLQLL